LLGPGVVAGGSLRARRSLTEQGIAVSPAAGFTSWGLYGLSMGAILAAEPIDSAGGDSLALIATVGLGGYIGSLIAANMQLGVNRRARHRSGRGSDIQRRPIE
jgi:hypothetical protein